jgi:hypothetical protein
MAQNVWRYGLRPAGKIIPLDAYSGAARKVADPVVSH